jgi:hypothetical protein
MKFWVYCPADNEVIYSIIKSASSAGAGVYGNYSQVAFITHGEGNWRSEIGSNPKQGKIGEVTRAKVAKIEMPCQSKDAKRIAKAIKKVHPWEQVDIEFIQLQENE